MAKEVKFSNPIVASYHKALPWATVENSAERLDDEDGEEDDDEDEWHN